MKVGLAYKGMREQLGGPWGKRGVGCSKIGMLVLLSTGSRHQSLEYLHKRSCYLIIIQDVSVQAVPERHTLCRLGDDQHTVVLYQASCKLQTPPLSRGKHLHRCLLIAVNHCRHCIVPGLARSHCLGYCQVKVAYRVKGLPRLEVCTVESRLHSRGIM